MLAAAAKSDSATPARIAQAVERLQAQLDHKVVTGRAVREQHANVTTYLPNEPADAVIFAECTEDVQAVVRICDELSVPVIPWGAGTSLEGHVNAPFGGICIDLSRMNRILSVNTADLDCVIEPGVTRKRLNEELRDQGLFFPIDPGADASLGGMVSTRCSGTNAVRYGTMKDNVLSLKVVTPTGEILTTATRARKSSAGYDLTRLYVGAEGTLGIITEITLKLYGIPEAVSAAVCPFPSIEAACNTVIATIQSGIPVARIELLDEEQVKASNAYAKLALAETPTLFLEFHGTEASVHEQADRFGELAAEYGGGPSVFAVKPEERTKLWQARHDAYWSVLPMRPGAKAVATDVCVPISSLAECVMETKRDIVEMGLIAPIVGHVGDGNFHTTLMVNVDDPEDLAKAKHYMKRLVERALAMGGTSTGEHGVGQGKMKYMEGEHGAAALEAMRAIKRALDPKNIMNPGKIVAI
ncbi:FAD-linked oxidase C-terminal domain-containing protein [Xanthobacter autotrophicus DSM 597]|uniref:FAD-binding oxidoreductase n=1 Tax=Xanthobacter TaxID=279 RepID=UPI001AEB710C|nr:FAD-linked oxidase C-terminal domain-containing protein [Xanthobacter flavus]MBP2150645.1 D-lactate dehydrogenase (cytochrome) [Xanthobacter flavus]